MELSQDFYTGTSHSFAVSFLNLNGLERWGVEIIAVWTTEALYPLHVNPSHLYAGQLILPLTSALCGPKANKEINQFL